MTIAADRAALAAASKVSGIPRTYPVEQDRVEAPCVIVGNPAATYDNTFEGEYTRTYPVTLLWSRGPGTDRAVAAIDDYLEPTGAKSIKAAIEAAVEGSRVVGFTDYGAYTIGDIEYPGVTFEVQVL